MADLEAQERTKMKMMTYAKARTKCDEIINSYNNCDSLYQDCSECPLNTMTVLIDNDEYITLCHMLSFFKDDIKEKIDKAIS